LLIVIGDVEYRPDENIKIEANMMRRALARPQAFLS
jgi:hypothetical protein